MNNHNTNWKPSVTADIVAIDSRLAKFRDDGTFINLLLIKRDSKSSAYPDHWALPSGFIEQGETIEQCAVRELKEETGLEARTMLPMGVFSNPNRDPRGQVISHAFLSLFLSTDEQPLPIKAGDDAQMCQPFLLKGSFNKENGSLSVKLRCALTKDLIVFNANFSRGELGLLKTEIVYNEKESTARLAFDHAEIIARTILRTPDLVLATSGKAPSVEDNKKELSKHLAE